MLLPDDLRSPPPSRSALRFALMLTPARTAGHSSRALVSLAIADSMCFRAVFIVLPFGDDRSSRFDHALSGMAALAISKTTVRATFMFST
jgi:hypothetical protein